MATPATAWALRGNLKGPTGATGPTGPAGPTGPTGATGAAGADGGTTPHAARHAVGGSDPVTPASIGAVALAVVGAASGVASLDSGSHVPVAQIPDLSGTYIATSRLDVSGGIPVLTGSVLPRKYQQYATATLDGTVVLTGDLGGTATNPTVPGLAGKAALVHTHAGADITSGTVAYARLPVGAAASTIAAGDDARFTGAVAYSRLPVGTAASTVAAGNDTRITGAEQTANKGAPNGYAGLDVGGKVPQAQLPSVALTDFLGAVATQAAMLALVGQRGDWCTRTDLGTDWQLITDDPTQLANWRQHVYPASPVSSVNGRTGPVVGLAEASALAGYVPTARNVTASTGLTGGGTLAGDISLAVAYGSGAGTAVQGNDARVVADQVAATASIRTLGTGAQQAAAGNHAHDLSGYVPSARTVSASTGLTGGGALTGNISLAVAYGSGPGTAAQGNDARITGAEQAANKGAASGYAGLDASALVAVANLPVNVANGIPQLDGNGVIPQNRMYAASTSTYGQILLAGDLGGTGAAPTVPGLAGKLDALGPVAVKTINYTLTDADATIIANSAGGPLTMTVPTAVGRTGKRYMIKKPGGNTPNAVTIASNGGTIDGQPTEVISMSAGFREIISDGTNWVIIGGRVEPVIATLTSPANGGTLAIDASMATVYRVSTTVAGFTLGAPTQMIDGDSVIVEITPSVAFALTINSAILLTTGLSATMNAAAGKRIFLGLRYVTGVAWFLVAASVQQ